MLAAARLLSSANNYSTARFFASSAAVAPKSPSHLLLRSCCLLSMLFAQCHTSSTAAAAASDQGLSVGNNVANFQLSKVIRSGGDKNSAEFQVTKDADFHSLIKDSFLTLLLFYPSDFTFVCPTEILAFSECAKLLKENYNSQILGISTDSIASHKKFIELDLVNGGLGGSIKFPLVADRNHQISRLFGVLDEETGNAKRGLFIVDSDAKLLYSLVSNDSVGRNADEAVRVVDALQQIKNSGGDNVCTANFKVGDNVRAKSHLDIHDI